MDPDACLSEIRGIVRHADHVDPDLLEVLFDRLVDLIDGMDTWMQRRPPAEALAARRSPALARSIPGAGDGRR